MRVLTDRSGTANRILEAKEKQREKEKTDRATKRAKRYVSVIFPTPFLWSAALSAALINGC
jgi:hypothetical protein